MKLLERLRALYRKDEQEADVPMSDSEYRAYARMLEEIINHAKFNKDSAAYENLQELYRKRVGHYYDGVHGVQDEE